MRRRKGRAAAIFAGKTAPNSPVLRGAATKTLMGE
jgi:hypothetical protein